MKSKYKVLIQISLLLTIVALATSFFNYNTSLKTSERQLKTISLPLSLDNIYTEIQKNIVEPYLISSMMAHDTFVQDWLKTSEQNMDKIVEYLSSVKNQYSMFNAFLVSDSTKKYYTQNGLIEEISIKNSQNKWYYDFISDQDMHEMNIDSNANLSNSLMMFINYKILDTKFKLIGVTGVALKTKYINNMLKRFRQQYGFKVTFFNENGRTVLSEKDYNDYTNIDNSILKPFKEKIISKESNEFEFVVNGDKHIINTKYISELNLYLTVEATLSSHTDNSIEIFYFNLLISLSVALFIITFIYRIIKNNNQELEDIAYIDSLTNLYNRRYFEAKLSKNILLSKNQHQNLCIVFIDIDNFKNINDTKGHDIGDEVLKIVSNIFQESIRETDIVARWGGEEMAILLSNIDIDDSKVLVENLRVILQNNIKLQALLSYNLTASFGLTQLLDSDDTDSIINRADDAMYQSKHDGKNKVTIL